MEIPQYLKELAIQSELNRQWVAALPRTIESLSTIWKLKLKAPLTENATCSYVVSCITADQNKAVLKIGLPHDEALHEADSLILLNGKPTVHLLKHERSKNALLLEHCIPGTSLNISPEPEQDVIICQTLQAIWKANIHDQPFRSLSTMVDSWNQETKRDINAFPDARLALEGCELKNKLINSTQESVLLATDLHAGNILKAKRLPWLAIDLKPYVGDPAYDLTQHIMNCMDRFYNDPHALITRLSNLAMIDPQRLQQWMKARLLTEHKGKHQELARKL